MTHPKTESTAQLIAEEARRYVAANRASEATHGRAETVLPGGDTRNSIFWEPFPVYIDHAQGSTIVDVDGNERTDFINNMTTLILGHRHPAVISALEEQLARGISYPAPAPLVVEWGELMRERVQSVDKIRFVNSGTEATLNAIRAARAYTGNNLLAKCEGAYHGNHDSVQISVTPPLSAAGREDSPTAVAGTQGISGRATDEIVMMPYNDPENAERIIRQYAADLAAVIVEPINGQCGMIPADAEFLQTLRDVTDELGILLIFDEVIAFRASRGGAQGYYGIYPDLTCFGKTVGGGLPVGAFGGRDDIMSQFDPSGDGPTVAHAGTFNGNPMTAAAGVATLKHLTDDAFTDLQSKGDYLRTKLRNIIARAEMPMSITGAASLFAIQCTPGPVTNYRQYAQNDSDMLSYVFLAMLNRGYLLSNRCAGNISTAHTYEDLDGFATAFAAVVAGKGG